ncbi:MAG TPA: hypothetical protein VII06_42975 [Chloroflexota bacterium]
MVNPIWGHSGPIFRRLRQDHVAFRTLNQLAWTTEMVAGLLCCCLQLDLLVRF